MARLNRLEVIGHLGGDPELNYTQSGKSVCNLSIAVNNSPKIDGEWTDETMWVRASVWNEAGERLAETLKKGNLVYAEGQLNVRDWQDRDGRDRYSIELKFARVMSLERKQRDADDSYQPEREPVGASSASAPLDVDDIPF